MSDTRLSPDHSRTSPSESSPASDRKTGEKIVRVAKICVWSLIALFGLAGLLICGLTFWLSPERLSDIVNRETSRYLRADVSVDDIRFTFWSSFPRLMVKTDQISIRSRTLDGIPDELRRSLPPDASLLASADSLEGGINLLALLSGEYRLRNLRIHGLRLNLVACNDSVNNFDIIPADSNSHVEIPFISADSISLVRPGELSYFSAESDSHIRASLSEASLTRTDAPAGNDVWHKHIHAADYAADFVGKISAKTGNLTVLRDFPFSMGGNIAIAFHPLDVSFRNFGVALGNTSGKLSLHLKLGQYAGISGFSYQSGAFNLLQLLNQIPPAGLRQLPQAIDTDIEVLASARLSAPYSFSSSSLPSLTVSIDVPEGTIAYTAPGGEKVMMKHGNLKADFLFDGNNPSESILNIAPFSVAGNGFTCSLTGSVSHLDSIPLLEAEVRADADLKVTARAFPALRPYNPKGKIAWSATLSTELYGTDEEAIARTLDNLKASGSISLDAFACHIPQRDADIAADRLRLRFSDSGLAKAGSRASLSLGSLSFLSDSISAKAENISLPHIPLSTTASGYQKYLIPPIHLTAGKASVSTPSTTLHLDSITLDFQAEKNHKKLYITKTEDYSAGPDELRVLEAARHTPLTINPPSIPALNHIIDRFRGHSRLTARSGKAEIKAYPAPAYLADLDLEASLDSICLHSLRVESQSNGADISAKISNLRDFLSSPQPAPLRVAMNLSLDTVNINQVARTYRDGEIMLTGGTSLDGKRKPLMADDSVCILVPRNLVADIHASVKETLYMNLHLRDLDTHLSIRDGIASVDSLRIDSDFGSASMNLRYDSSDASRMHADASVDISDINIVNFFRNFHSLLLMMPEMKNLDGTLSAQLVGGMDIYPDMFVVTPSVRADASLQGRGLTVHQNRFIHKIARMLLIRNHDDIRIADMNVHASVHDNLIELYPFLFEFDRYRLSMAGTNNFNGNLYYHIGVLHSPVPFPFGINISGLFHDPKLSFGGASFKNGQAADIATEIVAGDNMNIVNEMKYYLEEFVRHAAFY